MREWSSCCYNCMLLRCAEAMSQLAGFFLLFGIYHGASLGSTTVVWKRKPYHTEMIQILAWVVGWLSIHCSWSIICEKKHIKSTFTQITVQTPIIQNFFLLRVLHYEHWSLFIQDYRGWLDTLSPSHSGDATSPQISTGNMPIREYPN